MTRPKDVLTEGAVRPWHVIFILLVAYVVSDVAANKATMGLDPSYRNQVFYLMNVGLTGMIYLAFIAVVPEFRRALPVLLGPPTPRPSGSDLAWAMLAMLCWGYGLYKIVLVLPILEVRPEWFSVMGLYETSTPLGIKYLGLALGSVILAPIGEELMFRGFLMNLWMKRWGLWGAVIASSIVFGLFHRQHALFAGLMGFAFALVYLRYDSLLPGIALHATYNLLAFNWLLGQFSAMKARSTIQDLTNWIPEMIVAILFFPVAYIFWRRFRPAR